MQFLYRVLRDSPPPAKRARLAKVQLPGLRHRTVTPKLRSARAKSVSNVITAEPREAAVAPIDPSPKRPHCAGREDVRVITSRIPIRRSTSSTSSITRKSSRYLGTWMPRRAATCLRTRTSGQRLTARPPSAHAPLDEVVERARHPAKKRSAGAKGPSWPYASERLSRAVVLLR